MKAHELRPGDEFCLAVAEDTPASLGVGAPLVVTGIHQGRVIARRANAVELDPHTEVTLLQRAPDRAEGERDG